MSKYRETLPQLAGQFLITDGGLETDLIFHHGFELPQFAAFPLVDNASGRAALRNYYEHYIRIARTQGVGLLLESPTWRANPGWGALVGYDEVALDRVNAAAIELMLELRGAHESDVSPIVVSGQIGPRGDGYVVGDTMTADEAGDYHARQIGVFARAGADVVAALTMTYTNEAIGIVRAATRAAIPSVISFTVETDGRLPSGQALAEAIREVDDTTGGGPAYYMINCAHPTHFADVLETGADWTGRILGLRANASAMSHEELDNAEELDEGNPIDLAHDHARLRQALPHLMVLGGCCGTDHRHVEAVGADWRRIALSR